MPRCCNANNERAAALRQRGELAASTQRTINYLLKENDADRLRAFVETHPQSKEVLEYIDWRQSK